jgi:S-DNA-T family DNA segregation ATPase FtsK/SpoIIIE
LTDEELKSFLSRFKVGATIEGMNSDGALSYVDLKLNPGVKLSKLESISTEIALAMRASSVPRIVPMLSEGIVRIEFVSNDECIMFDDHIGSLKTSTLNIPVALGLSRDGREFVADLHSMPHLLIAGMTGSGKSVSAHVIINSIIETHEGKMLYLIDPKQVEFSLYENVRPVKKICYNKKDCIKILRKLERQMFKRLRKFKSKRVSNITEYRKAKPMDFIIVIIDELASLLSKDDDGLHREISKLLALISQLGRAAGIHLVGITQYPSVSVVKGIIKSNFPGRMSFRVATKSDSRVVLDRNGAETLRGDGDGLISFGKFDLFRFRGYYITRESIMSRAKGNKRRFFG